MNAAFAAALALALVAAPASSAMAMGYGPGILVPGLRSDPFWTGMYVLLGLMCLVMALAAASAIRDRPSGWGDRVVYGILFVVACCLSTASFATAGPRQHRAVCAPVHVEGVGTVRVCGLPMRRR